MITDPKVENYLYAMLPERDAVLAEIEQQAKERDIPIVILTAMPLGFAERELLAGRTREVIAKGADDLAQALRRILLRLPKAAEVASAD